MLNTIRKLRSKYADNIATKYGVSYVIVATLFVSLVYYLVLTFEWPEELAKFVAKFAFFNSIFLFGLIWITEPVKPTDRRLVASEAMWFYVPACIVWNLLIFTRVLAVPVLPISSMLGIRPGTPLVLVEGFVNIAVLILIMNTWFLMRWPFTRNNVLLKSIDKVASRAALSRLIWPMTLETIQVVEIRIAPSVYYSFLTLTFWATFVVLETAFSEYLGDQLGSASYVGASVIALAIGSVVYPIHKRASRYLDNRSSVGTGASAHDPKSALMSIVRSIRYQVPRILLSLLFLALASLALAVAVGLGIRLYSGCNLDIFSPC